MRGEFWTPARATILSGIGGVLLARGALNVLPVYLSFAGAAVAALACVCGSSWFLGRYPTWEKRLPFLRLLADLLEPRKEFDRRFYQAVDDMLERAAAIGRKYSNMPVYDPEVGDPRADVAQWRADLRALLERGFSPEDAEWVDSANWSPQEPGLSLEYDTSTGTVAFPHEIRDPLYDMAGICERLTEWRAGTSPT
jgi:hypothetical protein